MEDKRELNSYYLLVDLEIGSRNSVIKKRKNKDGTVPIGTPMVSSFLFYKEMVKYDDSNDSSLLKASKKKEGIYMLNEKGLEIIIKELKNIEVIKKEVNEEQFILDFDKEERLSENDFESLEQAVEKENIYCKCIRISGVYKDGDSNNKMIQELVGKCFASNEEKEKFIEAEEERKKRDHRIIGKNLDLFCFSDYVGGGLPLYSPRGVVIKDELQKEIEKICRKYGFQKVSCPSLADISLFETSGHAGKFNDELFRVSSPKGHEFVLKPVQCPHHTQIYASKIRSYKDLPIRYMESDKQYRAELQGAVGNSLSRVYAITIEDGHSFCRVDQVKEEVINMCNIIKDFYNRFGLYENC